LAAELLMTQQERLYRLLCEYKIDSNGSSAGK